MVTPLEMPPQAFGESLALQLDRPAEAPERAVPRVASIPRCVLIPLDGSDLAERVIPSLLDMARALDLRLVLLHVLPVLGAEAIEASAEAVEAASRRMHEDGAAYLGTVAARLAHQAQVETRLRTGDAATEIIEEARDRDADLIAMTTHGRSGVSRLLSGSVAEAVLRRTTVPVFLVPVREAEAGRRAA